MTTILEADPLLKPDTKSVAPRNEDIRVRPSPSQQMPKVVTFELPQQTSTFAVISEFRPQRAIDVVGCLNRSISGGRVYRVTVVDNRQVQATPSQAVDDQIAKHQEHRQYLQRVSTEDVPLITPATAKRSWNLWLAVRKAIGASMPIPSAGTGPDGVMFYSWDKGVHHLEAEIRPNQPSEFFYRNRQSGELWGEDYSGGALPAELLSKLELFR